MSFLEYAVNKQREDQIIIETYQYKKDSFIENILDIYLFDIKNAFDEALKKTYPNIYRLSIEFSNELIVRQRATIAEIINPLKYTNLINMLKTLNNEQIKTLNAYIYNSIISMFIKHELHPVYLAAENYNIISRQKNNFVFLISIDLSFIPKMFVEDRRVKMNIKEAKEREAEKMRKIDEYRKLKSDWLGLKGSELKGSKLKRSELKDGVAKATPQVLRTEEELKKKKSEEKELDKKSEEKELDKKSEEKESDKKSEEKEFNKKSEKNPEKDPEKNPEKDPEKNPEKDPEKNPEKIKEKKNVVFTNLTDETCLFSVDYDVYET